MVVKITAHRVRIDRGGYDSGGRYWGTGAPLYEVENDNHGHVVTKHVRAQSASEAKAKAFGWVSGGRKRPSRAGKSAWDVEVKIREAMAVRDQVSQEFLPLFDHLLTLARSDAKIPHAYGRRRAGEMIGKAKKLARKYPRTSGDRTRRRRSR